jgi:protein-L-isoaspartate(D-aspartate) O-methyltransferase
MTTEFAAARQNMVDCQVRPSDVTDYAIQDAMLLVERERLLAPDKAALAYADVEVAYAADRYLMRPRDLAKLLQALRPRKGEAALAIAAPYAAAVLQSMGLKVDRLDQGDLSSPPPDSYDVVVCEGAVGAAPPAWVRALRAGGRLGVVERNGPVGKAKLYVNADTGIGALEVFDATPPMLVGFETKPQFAF